MARNNISSFYLLAVSTLGVLTGTALLAGQLGMQHNTWWVVGGSAGMLGALCAQWLSYSESASRIRFDSSRQRHVVRYLCSVGFGIGMYILVRIALAVGDIGFSVAFFKSVPVVIVTALITTRVFLKR